MHANLDVVGGIGPISDEVDLIDLRRFYLERSSGILGNSADNEMSAIGARRQIIELELIERLRIDIICGKEGRCRYLCRCRRYGFIGRGI